jgi:IstB-like ATP binding protein
MCSRYNNCDSVVATALLDRVLHHAIVIQIEGSSYPLRQHADLVPERLRAKPLSHCNRLKNAADGRQESRPRIQMTADHRPIQSRQLGKIRRPQSDSAH